MIYLDSAATSFLKPAAVSRAVAYAIGHYSSSGRGMYLPARRAADCVYHCRETAAKLFHVSASDKIVFTMNATHALNIAVNSLVKKDSRILLTGLEHNAVYRPILTRTGNVIVPETMPATDEDWIEYFRTNLTKADAAVITHISNVYGNVLPLRELAGLCRQAGVPFIVDAAQSAGHLDIDADTIGADFIAMPGHKGLLGPQGTGILLCKGRTEPLLYGGTGGESLTVGMPEELPERLEAGTQNICGIAGLDAGMQFVLERREYIRSREAMLSDFLFGGLSSLSRYDVISFGTPLSVVSVVPRDVKCEQLEEWLQRSGVAVRSGLHCAPLAHRIGGTVGSGTVRFSVSFANTGEEISKVLYLLEKFSKNSYKM